MIADRRRVLESCSHIYEYQIWALIWTIERIAQLLKENLKRQLSESSNKENSPKLKPVVEQLNLSDDTHEWDRKLYEKIGIETTIMWLGVISSNMDNSAVGNNKSHLPLLSNIIVGRKPVLLVIFPVSCYFP